MAFTKFHIPKQAPDDRCRARIRVHGEEGYCDQETNGTRCPAHGTRGLVQRRWDKIRQAKATIESQDSLETRINALSAVIPGPLKRKSPYPWMRRSCSGT